MHEVFQLMHDKCIKGQIKLTVTAEYIEGEGVIFTAQLSDENFTYPDSYEAFTKIEDALTEAVSAYNVGAPR